MHSLMSGAHAASGRFTVAGVKSIDDVHSRDDPPEWSETFSIVLPVVAQIDVARVPAVINAYARVPRSFEMRAGSSAIVAFLQARASCGSPGTPNCANAPARTLPPRNRRGWSESALGMSPEREHSCSGQAGEAEPQTQHSRM